MKFFDKIISSTKSSLGKDAENELIKKIAITHFNNFFGIFISIILFIDIITNNQISNIIINALFSLFFVINIIIFLKQKNDVLYQNISVILIAINVLSINLFFENQIISYLLMILFPVITSIYYNYKKSLFLSLTLLLLVIAISVFYNYNNQFNINLTHYLSYTILYIGIYLFLNILIYINKLHELSIENSMLNKEKTLNQKSEFISKLSYQIRTPLNNMLGLTNILKENVKTEDKNLIDTIEASINNITEVVGHIDEAAKEKREHKNVIFNLEDSLKSISSLFVKSFRINFDFSNDIPDNLLGNPIHLKQIFLNIFELFNKYKTNRLLTLKLKVNVEKLDTENIICYFYIQSDYPVIFPEFKKQNKELEYELIDLNVTNSLIEELGGNLKISMNEVTTNIAFKLNFGFEKATLKQNKMQNQEQNINLKQKGIDLKYATVLVVEDNQINQKVMVLSLQKVVKSIDVAFNGKEALEKFAKVKYDIILMDIQMPIMDGIKATRKIREAESGTNTHVPIIAITANTLSGDMEECLEAGMDDYISKPFQLKEVIEKMNKHIKSQL